MTSCEGPQNEQRPNAPYHAEAGGKLSAGSQGEAPAQVNPPRQGPEEKEEGEKLMTGFTSLQKIYIADAVKREVDKLVSSWDKPLKIRELALIRAVANAILGLPNE